MRKLKAFDSVGDQTPGKMLFLVIISCLAWGGCQTLSQTSHPHRQLGTPWSCAHIGAQIDMRNRIQTLRDLAQAFHKGCYKTVIRYGAKAQTEYKYKTFSVLKEASNIFLPDGTLIDYVMESYERGFLTVLLAISYYQEDRYESAKVELRKLDHEIFTPLYNYGADPVNLLFSAVLWEMLDEQGEAGVDWDRLQRQEDIDEVIRDFASHRLTQQHAKKSLPGEWAIYAIGSFPAIDWNMEFLNADSGYFSVKPLQRFLPGCASETGVRLSTASWFRKIAKRHSAGYHPLLHVQSWLRLPVGVVYSITTFASGAGIAIGGCILDAAAHGNGSLCKVSVQGGVALIRESPKVLRYTLRPDLRHWDNVPSSFLFTTARTVTDEPCWPQGVAQAKFRPILFLDQKD